MCQVYYDELDGDRFIGFEYLLPVKPSQGDKVFIINLIFNQNFFKARVVYGPNNGKQGFVISVDGMDSVLKTPSGEMHAISMTLLCKII